MSQCGSHRIDHDTCHCCGRLPLAPGRADCTANAVNVGCKLIANLLGGVCMILVYRCWNKHRRHRRNTDQLRRTKCTRVLLTGFTLRLFPVSRQLGCEADELQLRKVLHHRSLRRWHTVFPNFTLLTLDTDRQRHSHTAIATAHRELRLGCRATIVSRL